MIDNQQLEQLVRESIQSSVDTRIEKILQDPEWTQSVEQKIISYIRHRISSSFTNVASSPDIVSVIKEGVGELMSSGLMPGLDQYVDQDKVRNAVYSGTQDIVKTAIDQLVLDPNWLHSIEQSIVENLARKAAERLSRIDVGSLVVENLDRTMENVLARRKFKGLIDQAQSVQLELEDDLVTVNHQLQANSISSQQLMVQDTLTVKNLAVKGSINTDNRAWQELSEQVANQASAALTEEWRSNLIQQVKQQIQEQGIQFESVKVAGQQLISGDRLADSIKHSSLESVGTLAGLAVNGDCDLGSGLSVRSRRVGINTKDPDMALAVWDEEVALVLGKHKDQTAYIGTLRPQRLIVGINRAAAIDISDSGSVTIAKLTVGRHRICHEPECPNYSGTKGDIVFNSNPKNDGVWGWQCLGAFRWTPLRTT